MSRFATLLALAMVISTFGSTPSHAQLAMNSGMTPDLMILRAEPDETWQIMNDASGAPLVLEGAQLVAGVPQYELSATALSFYEQFHTQDVYFHQASFLNPEYQAVATNVEMRVITFLDTQNASDYLNGVYDNQLEASAGAEFDPQYATIDPLPQFEYPLIGWTRVIDYIDNSSDEYSGLTSAVRYHAQVGQVVISAQVTGPFVDYNFDLTLALLEQQASCIESDSPCEGVSMSRASDQWLLTNGVFSFAPEGLEARWIWPVTEPVRAPDVSYSFSEQVSRELAEQSLAEFEPVVGIVVEPGPVLAKPIEVSEIVDELATGESLTWHGSTILNEGVVWMQVVTERGIEGWVPSEWLTFD